MNKNINNYGNDSHTLLLLHGESIEDSSMYNVPLTNHGVVVSSEQSKFGGKSLFVSSGSFIDCLPQLVEGDFTIDWWEYIPNSFSNFGVIFDCESNNHFLLAYYSGGDQQKIGIWDNPWNGKVIGTQKLNKWIHRALIKKGSALKSYENGKMVFSDVAPDSMLANVSLLRIGQRKNQNINQPWNGYIDEFRVSNVVRWESDFTPPTEPYSKEPPSNQFIDENTLLLLHGESVVDSSQYHVPLTNQGVVVSAVQSKFGEESMYFDGTGYIEFPEKSIVFSDADFTIDWWEFYENGSSVPCRFSTVGKPGYGFAIFNDNIKVGNNGAWNQLNWLNSIDVVANQWVHRAVVRFGNELTSYKNGKRFASTSLSGAVYNATDGTHGYIGVNPNKDAGYCWKGYIDEFRISNIARWTSDFTPPDKPYEDIFLKNLKINIGNSWKEVKKVFLKIDGKWIESNKIYSKINKEWK